MWWRIEAFIYFIRYMRTMSTLGKIKEQAGRTLVQKQKSWPVPTFSPPNTKIIWGFWHNVNDLPPLCQLALESWKAHHPDWTIVILDDSNYRQYVPASDVPSTFESLSPQHRSDILRLSVLIRYGGVYMDMTTIALKSFDDIFSLSNNKKVLYLTAPLELSNGVGLLPNNSLFISPTTQHPVLKVYLKKLLIYSQESLCANERELRQHILFPRTQEILKNDRKRMGVITDMPSYLSFLYLLFETLYLFRPAFKENEFNTVDNDIEVMVLPPLRWSFEFFAFGQPTRKRGACTDSDEEEITNSTLIKSWSLFNLVAKLYRYIYRVRFGNVDEEDVAKYSRQVHCIKLSTASPDFKKTKEELLSMNSTQGALFRLAIRPPSESIPQANLDGVRSYYDFMSQKEKQNSTPAVSELSIATDAVGSSTSVTNV